MKWLLSIFLHSSLLALPMGNPVEPKLFGEKGLFKCRIGYQQDSLFNANLRRDASSDRGDIHQARMITNNGIITLDFRNQLDLFATLGTSSFFIHTPQWQSVTGGAPLNQITTIDFDTAFSWSVGARGTLWKQGPLNIGFEGVYFSTNPSVITAYSNLARDFHYADNISADYKAWQFAIGLTYRQAFTPTIVVIPYVGFITGRTKVSFDDAQLTLTNVLVSPTLTFLDLISAKQIGYAVGFTLAGNEKITLGIEGRFAYELAATFNTQLRF